MYNEPKDHIYLPIHHQLVMSTDKYEMKSRNVCFQFVNVEDCSLLCVQSRAADIESGDTAFAVAESVLGVVLLALLCLATFLGYYKHSIVLHNFLSPLE